MSFNIFASGSNNFHYSRKNMLDGEEFDAAKLYATMGFMDHSVAGVIDAGLGYVSPGMTDLYVAIATMEFLHNLKNAIDILAMQPNPRRGWINVAAFKDNLVFDDSSYSTYRFSPGNHPATEFVKKIGPGLKETDMDNFGVLRALSIVLGLYANKIGKHNAPMININLSK